MPRILLTLTYAVAAAVLCVALVQPAEAADGKKKTTKTAQQQKPKAGAKATPQAPSQPGWAVQCNNPGGKGLVCKAFQTLALRKTGQRLVTVSVQRNKDAKSVAMLVQLPHGLYLPAGIVVKTDKGKPLNLVVQTCDARGCYAGGAIKAADLDAWFDGKILAIVFQNLAKKTINVQMPLKGFDDAFAKLK